MHDPDERFCMRTRAGRVAKRTVHVVWGGGATPKPVCEVRRAQRGAVLQCSAARGVDCAGQCARDQAPKELTVIDNGWAASAVSFCALQPLPTRGTLSARFV